MKQLLIFIFGLGLFCFSCKTPVKVHKTVSDDFSEYYYHVSHLKADSLVMTANGIIVPNYQKDLLFLDGYKIPTCSARDMNGNIVNIDYKSKLTLLNFWFIACYPCVEELPFLNMLQQKYSDKLQVISLCTDSEFEIAKFLGKHHLEYVVIPNAKDIIENRFRMFWGYPKSILVDQDGKVLGMTRNFLGQNDMNFQKIDNLINNYHSKL